MTSQQLKNSILQMAVQGLLVPQDPNDEPASVLLQRMREEKQKLVKEGKIKKEKHSSVIFRGSDNLPYESRDNSTPVCIADLIPFEIPESWEWARLGEVCTKIIDGNHNPPKGCNYKTAYIMGSSTNIANDKLVQLNVVRYLDKDTFEKENQRTHVTVGDILFTSVGTLGRSCIFQGGLNLCFQRSVSVITTKIYNAYLKYLLDSPSIQQFVKRNAAGTAQKGFYLKQLSTMCIPIPPLAEQRRIVAKLEELLPLVEEYGKAESTLTTLNATFPEALKKSILQDAVQGKLVPQDPNDEPASVLLERIRREKKALDKTKKGKRNAVESRIVRRDNSYYELCDGVERCVDELLPFEIPDSWEWARLGEVGNTNIGLTYKPQDVSQTDGTIVLRSNNIQKDKMCYQNIIKVKSSVPERALIHKGDLLICARNGSRALVGKSAIVDRDGMAFGAFMAKFSSPINEYIHVFLNSNYFRSQLDDVGTETINQITQERLRTQLIPIPPLAEQRRIVAKLEELLKQVEKLK